jgi:hypothetical protein
MEDKDLDKYFKDRSGAFNEAPGEGLWAKIEANIEPAAKGGFKGGKWLYPGAGLVVATGLVAAWLVTRNTVETPEPVQQPPHKVAVVTDSVVPVANTQTTKTKDTVVPVAKKTETKPAAKQPAITQPTPVALAGNATRTEEFESEGDKNAAPSSQPFYTYHVNRTKDPVATPGKKNIPYNFELDEGKDAMEISVTQKITPAERNALITNTVKGNAPYVGRKIVIKAKGYRIYRHTISQADYNRFARQQDTLQQAPMLNLKVVTDTVFYKLDSDSLPAGNTNFKISPKAKKE